MAKTGFWSLVLIFILETSVAGAEPQSPYNFQFPLVNPTSSIAKSEDTPKFNGIIPFFQKARNIYNHIKSKYAFPVIGDGEGSINAQLNPYGSGVKFDSLSHAYEFVLPPFNVSGGIPNLEGTIVNKPYNQLSNIKNEGGIFVGNLNKQIIPGGKFDGGFISNKNVNNKLSQNQNGKPGIVMQKSALRGNILSAIMKIINNPTNEIKEIPMIPVTPYTQLIPTLPAPPEKKLIPMILATPENKIIPVAPQALKIQSLEKPPNKKPNGEPQIENIRQSRNVANLFQKIIFQKHPGTDTMPKPIIVRVPDASTILTDPARSRLFGVKPDALFLVQITELSNSGGKNSTDITKDTTGGPPTKSTKLLETEAAQKMVLAQGSNTISPYENFDNTDYFDGPDLQHNVISPDFDYKIPSFDPTDYVNDFHGDVPGESDYLGGFGSIEF